jgi:hypothetical protein
MLRETDLNGTSNSTRRAFRCLDGACEGDRRRGREAILSGAEWARLVAGSVWERLCAGQASTNGKMQKRSRQPMSLYVPLRKRTR